jgi:hypothetical protein
MSLAIASTRVMREALASIESTPGEERIVANALMHIWQMTRDGNAPRMPVDFSVSLAMVKRASGELDADPDQYYKNDTYHIVELMNTKNPDFAIDLNAATRMCRDVHGEDMHHAVIRRATHGFLWEDMSTREYKLMNTTTMAQTFSGIHTTIKRGQDFRPIVTIYEEDGEP